MPRRKLNPLRQRPVTAIAPRVPRQLIVPSRLKGGGPPVELRNFAYSDGTPNLVLPVNEPGFEPSVAGGYRYKFKSDANMLNTGAFFGTNNICSRLAINGTYQITWFGTTSTVLPNDWLLDEVNVFEHYWPAGAGAGRRQGMNGNYAAGNVGTSNALQNFIFGRSQTSKCRGFMWDLEIFDGDPDQGGVLTHFFPMNEGAGNIFTDVIGGVQSFDIGDPGQDVIWQNDVPEPTLP